MTGLQTAMKGCASKNSFGRTARHAVNEAQKGNSEAFEWLLIRIAEEPARTLYFDEASSSCSYKGGKQA